MERSSSTPARIAAAGALIVALVVAIMVIGAAGGGDDSSDGNGRKQGGQASRQAQRKVPASYTIESGDTLTSIAHRTGVPVAQIQRLNPQVDPQILIAGEELKLR